MKVLEDGKIKLAADEKRNGNFVLKLEKNHTKIFDVSELFSFRVRRNIPIGQFLEGAYKDMASEDTSNGIRNYIVAMWTVQATVPDSQFLKEIYEAAVACMKRHPDVYGVPKENISDSEDAAIIESQKELHEFENEVREAAGKEEKPENE